MAIGREHMVDASEYHREAGTVDSLLVPTIFSQVSRRRAYTDCLCPASFSRILCSNFIRRYHFRADS